MTEPKLLEELLGRLNQPGIAGSLDMTAFEMARRLRKLAERHKPGGGCVDCCRGRYCPDAEILEGKR